MKTTPCPRLQLRAENNILALDESDQDHIRYVTSLNPTEYCHAVACMTPVTGCPSSKRGVRLLEVLHDHEKANKYRKKVLGGIEAAFRKHRIHSERFGSTH